MVRVAGSEVCVSSEIKLCRSVFTKGLMAVLIETLVAARSLNAEDIVLTSISDFMAEDFQKITEVLVGSAMTHAERRTEEMREARQLVVALLGGAPTTSASIDVLDAVADRIVEAGAVTGTTQVVGRLAEGRLFEALGAKSDREGGLCSR
jgi:hypothetical protein